MKRLKQKTDISDHCFGVNFGVASNKITAITFCSLICYSDFPAEREERFPGTKVYFRDEEPGLENYTTNSFEHFPERYFLDTSEDSMYFESLEETAEYVEDMVGHKVEADMNSIQQALSDYEDKHKEEKWMYYSFHEFKLID